MSGFIRSVRCTVVNSSSHALVRKSDPEQEHKHGSYDEPKPPARVEPGATATWNTSTAGLFTGTEGTVTFAVEGTSGAWLVSWDNPFIGDNTFDHTCTGVSDWQKVPRTAQDPNTGDALDEARIKSDDDVHVTYTFLTGDAPKTETGKGDDARPTAPVVQTANGPTGQVSLPAGAKRILLIPKSGNDDVQKDNIAWAAQWKKKDPTTRDTKIIPNKTGQGDVAAFELHMGNFAKAVEEAAKAAGTGGEIILFTGHGSVGGQTGPVSAFDTTPEQDSSAAVERTRQKITQQDAAMVRNKMHSGGRVSTIRDAIKKMREAMNGAGVKRFTILACDVGRDTEFMGWMASKDMLNVEVGAYKRIVLSGAGKHGVQLWVPSTAPPANLTIPSMRDWAMKNAPPPDGSDKNAESYHTPPLTQLRVVDPEGKACEL